MAFVMKLLFLSALALNANAGVLSGHHSSDSFLSSGLDSPSANFGPPSTSYGPPAPALDIHRPEPSAEGSLLADDHSLGLDAFDSGHGNGQSFVSSPALGSGPGLINPALNSEPAFGADTGFSGLESVSGAGPALVGSPIDVGLHDAPAVGPPLGNDGGSILDTGLNGPATTTAVGAPRVIGTTVTVGRPQPGASRYELQSVVQNVIRRVPIEVTRHVQVAVPQPIPVPVRQEVKVPVPQPYPVHVDVVKHVPYPVYKTKHVEVERPVPVEVVKHVPFEVIKEVHIPVDRPYEVIKKVHVPVEKHVEVPVPVWKPYPIHIIKHVTHYKKKSCCW